MAKVIGIERVPAFARSLPYAVFVGREGGVSEAV
jgi:hypothetical protein